MGWLKLDENFFLNPKALAAGRDGRDIYLAALCYSSQQQTDGVIHAHALAIIGGLAGVADADQAATRLCEAGLWHPHVDGWMIHDYLEHQQSKGQREAWKQRERERKARDRDARKVAENVESVRAESARNPADVLRVDQIRSDQIRTESSSSSSGRNHQAGDQTPPTTDRRTDEILELLGRADHDKAAAAGTPIRNPARHLAACIDNRRASYAQTVAAAIADHPDWDNQRIANHLTDPRADKRAKLNQALGTNHGPR